MKFEELVRQNVTNTIEETDFPGLGAKYAGKVRDNYTKEDQRRVIIATDRLSAFDRVITTIPFKGRLLNEMSNFWFDYTKAAVPNHVLSVPDPNVTVVKECQPYPVEMIVRAYLTGSGWRAYDKGDDISGIQLPAGLKKNQQLDERILTPSTKAEKGIHDEAISREEILERELVPKGVYEQMEEYALKLFEMGSALSAEHGLILVDTKYEFGDYDGQLVVIDEIHTPDSSRYWIKDSYEERFAAGEEPEILDKEFFRGWLMEPPRNYQGDGPIPAVPPEIKVQLASRYKQSYETITARAFTPGQDERPVMERIRDNLEKAGLL